VADMEFVYSASTLVGQAKGDAFIERHFSDKPDIVDMYHSLPNAGMKSDFLRYLILDVEGGVYTDIDTQALKPISQWVPAEYRDQARLIVGIEFDRRDGGSWADIPHWLQFAQWTIAAAPGHPVFPKMVKHVLMTVTKLAEERGVSVSELTPSSFEVMNSTGPAAWTDVVFAQLQEYEPELETTKDLSFMTGPRLIGDILVLNIDGFGMGQSHSHATADGSIPDLALAKHLFWGSWRGGD
jgi:alpha 1,6-mannosyltransferase